MPSEQALDGKARRAAKRAGLYATKSRSRTESIDNLGGFMLIHPQSNFCVAGEHYDLSAQNVIDWCTTS
jgi:hypothetical protein